MHRNSLQLSQLQNLYNQSDLRIAQPLLTLCAMRSHDSARPVAIWLIVSKRHNKCAIRSASSTNRSTKSTPMLLRKLFSQKKFPMMRIPNICHTSYGRIFFFNEFLHVYILTRKNLCIYSRSLTFGTRLFYLFAFCIRNRLATTEITECTENIRMFAIENWNRDDFSVRRQHGDVDNGRMAKNGVPLDDSVRKRDKFAIIHAKQYV